MLKTREMLIMLIMLIPGELWGVWGGVGGQKRINIINISPVLSTFLEKVAKTGEMLIMLIPFGGFLTWGGSPIVPEELT